jgi:hypothetical protein
MEIRWTDRGFEIVEFTDLLDQQCTLQQSSIALFEKPGSGAIWLGPGKDRMHLRYETVVEILPLLQSWVENGSFVGVELEPPNFRDELTQIINRHSKEQGSDTPDFILAEFLDNVLQVYDEAVSARKKWNDPFDAKTRAE